MRCWPLSRQSDPALRPPDRRHLMMTAQTTQPPTQEFLLVAACSIWPPSKKRDAAIEQAARSPLEWDRVVRVAVRQRVIGLVHDGLRRAQITVPEAASKAIG